MRAVSEKPPILFGTPPAIVGQEISRETDFIVEILGRPLERRGHRHISVSGDERSISWIGDGNELPEGTNEEIISALSERGVTGGLTISKTNGTTEVTKVVLDEGRVLFRSDPLPEVDPRQITLFER